MQTACISFCLDLFLPPNHYRNISRLTSTNTGSDSKNAKNPCSTLYTLNDTGITLLSITIW